MDRLTNFIGQKSKIVASVAAILITIFVFTGCFGNDEKDSTGAAAVEEKNSAEDEFELSLGDLKLCMNLDKLQKIKGKEKSIENFPGSKYPYYMYDNMSVMVGNNDLIFGIIGHADSSEIKTEKGIHSGSSIDEIFAAYGRDCVFMESGDDEGNDLFLYPFKSKGGNNFAVFTFHIYGDRVKNIDLALVGEDICKDLSAKVKTFKDHVLVRDFNLSLGNIKLGNTVEEVKNVYGDNKKETLGSDGRMDFEYPDIKFTFNDDVVTTIIAHGGNIEAGGNIRKGSTIDEVFAAYGDTCAVSTYNSLTLMEYLYESSNGRTAVMRFAMNGSNVVDYMSLRLVDENDKKNIVSVTKNYRQELAAEQQRREEEARRAAEAQRQAELERQRQSQPREILAHTTRTRVEFTEHYLVRGSARQTDYGIKAQFHETGTFRGNQCDEYVWHTFIYRNGVWYFGPDAETWESWPNEYRIKYTQVMTDDPMHGFDDMFNAAYRDLSDR